MDNKLAESLEAALSRHLCATDDAAPSLEIGEYRLADSPAFGRDVADTTAELSGLPRWDDFRRLFGMRDTPKPSRPSAEFIEAEARAIERDAARQPYAMALIADRLNEAYFLKLTEYEAKRKERERVEQNYENSDLGYIRFLCAEDPQARSFFFDRFRTLPISEEDRRRHTYITGGAGSGKSEAIKNLLFHYLARNTQTAVVLIDPHGDVAEQVARWPELADGKRLVYIDPMLEKGQSPIFNPLDIPASERNPDDIAILVKEIIEIFPEIIHGLEFTPQMDTMVSACLTVLLNVPGSSLADLMDFMDDAKNKLWLEQAEKVLPENSYYRSYFRKDFMDKTSDISKRGIRMRLLNVFEGNPPFLRMIVGKSTFNLEELLKRHAAVIFRLSRGDIGGTTSSIIGKFIIARIKAFGFKQARIPEDLRTHVHLHVDECQNYISDSVEEILKEARKYGIHLTLAQQILGDGMSQSLIKAILGNTAVRITGKNATFTLSRISDETGASMEELQSLTTGRFHIQADNRKSVAVWMPSHRLKMQGAISDQAWAALRESQLARFYRAPTKAAHTVLPSQHVPFPID